MGTDAVLLWNMDRRRDCYTNLPYITRGLLWIVSYPHGWYIQFIEDVDSIAKVATTYHHHHHVACPCRSVAVSTISRHSLRSHALCRADHRPRFCCFRSFSIVRSHVCRGRPRGSLQSFGGSSMPALRARVWSSSESERTMWPKNLRRLVMIVWVTRG